MALNNREFAQTDKEFQEACRKAGIPPTQRQASKFRLRSGKAFQFRNGTRLDNGESHSINLSQE
jgi:hypothetical protein